MYIFVILLSFLLWERSRLRKESHVFYVTKCKLVYFTNIGIFNQRIVSRFVEIIYGLYMMFGLYIWTIYDVVQNQYFKKLTRQEAVSSDVSSEGNFQNVLIFRIGKIELFWKYLKDPTCAICLVDYVFRDRISMFSTETPSQISKLKCGHVFHFECVETWLNESVSEKFPRRPPLKFNSASFGGITQNRK